MMRISHLKSQHILTWKSSVFVYNHLITVSDLVRYVAFLSDMRLTFLFLFYTGSRRLITYRRLPEGVVAENKFIRTRQDNPNGVSADELNAFRRKVSLNGCSIVRDDIESNCFLSTS